jgi:hypothetical protein
MTEQEIENKLNGYYRTIQFDNGYGLSIISHGFSYGGSEGLFEIALLDEQGVIMYDKDMGFTDVVGHLDFEDVAAIIKGIRALPPRDKTKPPHRSPLW